MRTDQCILHISLIWYTLCYGKLMINPSEYEVILQIKEIINDFLIEVFNIPAIISVSIKIAAISEINLYQSFVLKNKGKINHKYGKVAIEVIIPVSNISFSGKVSFRYKVLERTTKTIVSMETVKSRDLRNSIS